MLAGEGCTQAGSMIIGRVHAKALAFEKAL